MNSQKVILRFLDGRIIKGYVSDFLPQSNHISIEDEAANKQDCPLTELKAVFYVKSFEGNRDYADKRSFTETSQKGKKILVRFKDGERLIGYLEGDVPWQRGFFLESKKGGFFLIPADDQTNNMKVFVVSTSVTDVTCF
jgi:small nuclear ribonucleoprotein (snRNP)-like protein